MNTTRAAEEHAAGRTRQSVWRAVFVAVTLGALVALGAWQVHRLNWKNDLIAVREAALALPPLELSRNLPDADAVPFRRVRVRGEFLHRLEIQLGPRTHRGAAGYHVITPLRLAGGGTVLVNRGWAPTQRRDPATRREGQTTGVVRIDGLVRPPPAQGWVTPDNAPGKGDWYFIDIAAIASHLGLSDVAPVMIEAGPAPNPGGYPLGGHTIVAPVNNHLQYAVTWFALAAVLLAIYIIDFRNRRRRKPPG